MRTLKTTMIKGTQRKTRVGRSLQEEERTRQVNFVEEVSNNVKKPKLSKEEAKAHDLCNTLFPTSINKNTI